MVGLGNTVETKKAEDLEVGDSVWAPTYTEYTDESDQSIEDWEADMLSNIEKTPTTVISTVAYVKPTLYFNSDESTRISFEQIILIKPVDQNWKYLEASEAAIGDTIMKYDPALDSFEPIVIINITQDVGDDRVVYGISVEETDTFIAGNIVVHNK
jgi:intein/homing endonuclease